MSNNDFEAALGFAYAYCCAWESQGRKVCELEAPEILAAWEKLMAEQKPVAWISVNERLPDNSQWVLVYANGAMNCRGFYNEEWKDWCLSAAPNIVEKDITHWMPLPEFNTLPVAHDAEAEVERLKAGGCARDQGLTQYCAEAAKFAEENAGLRELLQQVAEETAPWTITLMSTEWGKACKAALKDKP